MRKKDNEKNKLEEKTKQLELSIETANERNKYIETLFVWSGETYFRFKLFFSF